MTIFPMNLLKKLFVGVPLVLVLLGAGCRQGVEKKSTSEAQPSHEVQESIVAQTQITSSTTKGWNVLTNNKYGYTIEYPCTWKVGQYTDSSGNEDGVVAIALDPNSVSTAKEYETLDRAPGQIWLRRGEYETTGTVARKMGMGGMMAHYRKIVSSGPTTPNPWWQNKTSEEYDFGSLDNQYVMQMYYPNSEASSTQKQTVMQKIINSFQFIK